MSAPKQPELTTKELPDELQFRYACASGHFGWIVFLVFVPFIFMLLPIATRAPIFFAIMMSMFLAGGLYVGIDTARNWNRVYSTTLSVTAQRLQATGDNLKPDWMGHYTRPGTIEIPVSEVTMLSYSPGDGESCPSGLCVNSRIVLGAIAVQGRCIMPGLNREQATAAIVAIARRFPSIGAKMQPRN
jgi:hypothetical protein